MGFLLSSWGKRQADMDILFRWASVAPAQDVARLSAVEHELKSADGGKDGDNAEDGGQNPPKVEEPDDGPDHRPDEGEDARDDEAAGVCFVVRVEGADGGGAGLSRKDDGDDSMHNRPRKDPADDGIDDV